MATDNVASQKWATTFLLCLFGGFLGLHRFYSGHFVTGIIQLLTLGGVGIWWLLDLFTIFSNKFRNRRGSVIQRKRGGCFWVSIVVLICTASFIIAAVSAPQEITTSEGLHFTVPGDSARMDGRDGAEVMVNSINIWDSPSRSQVVCELEHGTLVNLQAAQYSNTEDRYYIRVANDTCSGWVSDNFIGE